MRTAAVLPVKRFGAAKQRLRASVPEALRAALAEAMLQDVLEALAHTRAIGRTFVVTCEPLAARAARQARADTVHDRDERGQSAAAGLGIEAAVHAGFERVLCVPGDCPALDPQELEALLAPRADAAAAELAIVPDRHGTGTNALLLSPPRAIEPAFGAGSCARHVELARSSGIPLRIERLPSLLLDVDTGADLAALRELLAKSGERAARTRALLDGERGRARELRASA